MQAPCQRHDPDPVARAAAKPAYVRNQACQTCHREIYESYSRTPMARTALPLWKRSFAEDPGRSGVGMDLALGLCKSGDAAGARDTLMEVLRHNPDLGRARAMLREVDSAPGDCGSAVPLHR